MLNIYRAQQCVHHMVTFAYLTGYYWSQFYSQAMLESAGLPARLPTE